MPPKKDLVLKKHWAPVSSFALDPHTSNVRYKYHVARLIDLHSSNQTFLQESRSTPKLNRSLSPSRMEGIKDIAWENHLNFNNKKSTVSEDLRNVLASGSSRKVNDVTKLLRHRCENEKLTDTELILKGQYRLTDQQMQVYNDFVDILAEQDPHNMVKILEDAIQEAQERTLLSSYGGVSFVDSSRTARR